jgi:hypothetical protein
MKRNCETTPNFWFLFFVTEIESSQVSGIPISIDTDDDLITTISLSEDENLDQSDSSESADDGSEDSSENLVDPARTRGGDPARTRVVDPARTRVVDPARTRVVDPARTRGDE